MELRARRTALALCLSAAAGWRAAADPGAAAQARPSTARRAFLDGVEAHIDGQGDAAQRHWRRCAGLAAKGSQEELDCRLYAGMFGSDGVTDAPGSWPEARRAYRAGIAAYRAKEPAEASRRWHECLGSAQGGTRAIQDCLVALELVRRPSPPPRRSPLAESDRVAHEAFVEGLLDYIRSDFEKARTSWKRCIEYAVPGGGVEAVCRSGLAKIEAL